MYTPVSKIKCITAEHGAAMSGNENGWSEYSKLVLKELETLAKGIDSVKDEMGDLKQELIVLKNQQARIDELREWKGRIDDVVSPVQLKDMTADVAELKAFKTKAITIFAVIQFLMAAIVFTQNFFGAQ
jgi:hypothetical protein